MREKILDIGNFLKPKISKIDQTLLVFRKDLNIKIVEVREIGLCEKRERIKKDYLKGIYIVDDDLET